MARIQKQEEFEFLSVTEDCRMKSSSFSSSCDHLKKIRARFSKSLNRGGVHRSVGNEPKEETKEDEWRRSSEDATDRKSRRQKCVSFGECSDRLRKAKARVTKKDTKSSSQVVEGNAPVFELSKRAQNQNLSDKHDRNTEEKHASSVEVQDRGKSGWRRKCKSFGESNESIRRAAKALILKSKSSSLEDAVKCHRPALEHWRWEAQLPDATHTTKLR